MRSYTKQDPLPNAPMPQSFKVLDLDAFQTAMHAAVQSAQAGLYYDMGGCWALAHALFSRLKALGYDAQLVYRPSGFVHAWVMVAGHNLDYRGVFRAAPGAVALKDLTALERVAASLGGMRGAAYEDDIASAHRLLDKVFAQSDLSVSAEATAA